MWCLSYNRDHQQGSVKFVTKCVYANSYDTDISTNRNDYGAPQISDLMLEQMETVKLACVVYVNHN
jgi:hypothetical protein